MSLPNPFLRGIIGAGDTNITHAIGEVYLEGKWIQSDTYVADDALEIQALTVLQQKGQSLAYGIHGPGRRY